LLLAWSTLFAQLFSIGMNGVAARMFAYFRDKKTGHHGFLFVAFTMLLLGFFLFLIAYAFFSPLLIENNIEKSFLFSQYVSLLIPLTLFTMLFTFLDSFNTLLYNAVIGVFLQEFLQRILVLVVVVVFIIGWFDIHQLILAYVVAISIKGLVIFIFLLIKGEMNLKPQLSFIDKKLRNEMISVAVFSILAGLGNNIVFRIDKIIINQLLGLSVTGVYTIAFFFGSLVVLPSRPLLRISGTLIADAWKNNDLRTIKDIYYKSCLNQLIIGDFLFLGIWANIDNILIILGDNYAHAKWVIFFIGLGYLIDMSTGANSLVIRFSKYYRINLLFLAILVVLVIGLMYLLIPLYGITGAAIAITVSFFLNNLMRFWFLYRKYDLQPFNIKFLIVILFFVFVYVMVNFIPSMALVWDILLRGSLISVLTVIFFFLFPVSEDVKQIIMTVKNKIKRK
jgi:O-antigen/teichoic acid export membrane protein